MIVAADEVKMRRALFLPLLPVLLATLLWFGCGREAPPAEPAATSAPADVYVVRGEVVRLPNADDGSGGFYVRHEAIDDFKAADGSVIGMDAMTMRFPLSDPALLDGLAVGDKVEITYEVDWHGQPMQQATKVTKLPPETELVFREANPGSN
jgi:Cu/Ag efflux protein CusF